jgi:hypothetical protein
MSPIDTGDTGIKAVHLWTATALVLAGMGSMILVAGRWQGEVNTQLRNMTDQVQWLRNDVSAVVKQVQEDAQMNAVQDAKLDQLMGDRTQRIYVPPGRRFDR